MQFCLLSPTSFPFLCLFFLSFCISPSSVFCLIFIAYLSESLPLLVLPLSFVLYVYALRICTHTPFYLFILLFVFDRPQHASARLSGADSLEEAPCNTCSLMLAAAREVVSQLLAYNKFCFACGFRKLKG